jgi:hypothetical protein
MSKREAISKVQGRYPCTEFDGAHAVVFAEYSKAISLLCRREQHLSSTDGKRFGFEYPCTGLDRLLGV